MKIRLRHHLSVAFLIALFASPTVSCSGDQQQLEDAVQQEDGEEGGEQGSENEGGNGAANEGGNGYDEGAAAGNLAQAQAGGTGQQDELQEIIDGMNGPAPVEGEQPPMAELPPVEPPVNTTTSPEAQQQAAVGMAAAPGLPELGSKMSYVIKRGDTLASVATKIYGDLEKWREIAEFTGMANPNMIYPGDVIYYQLTDQTMAFAAAYESVKRAEVVVQPGDTLSTISSRVMGRSSDWKMIWRQNDNIDNPDKLIVGQTLYYVDPGMLMSAVDSAKDVQVEVAAVAAPESSESVVQDSVSDAAQLAQLSALVNSVEDEFATDFSSLQTVGFNSVI